MADQARDKDGKFAGGGLGKWAGAVKYQPGAPKYEKSVGRHNENMITTRTPLRDQIKSGRPGEVITKHAPLRDRVRRG